MNERYVFHIKYNKTQDGGTLYQNHPERYKFILSILNITKSRMNITADPGYTWIKAQKQN